VTDRGLADTSLFIALESGRPIRSESLPDSLAISVITLAELRAGVLGAVDVAARARRLATLTAALALQPLMIDEAVAEAWASLRIVLRDAGRTMPVNDSWIAATAIVHAVPVVTQDDDYLSVPGLEVIRV